MEDLMSGEITYYLEVLETELGEIHPLQLIDSFSKETRPSCWKNCDLKVEAILPILGNDVETTKTINDKTSINKIRMAKICLRLNHLN